MYKYLILISFLLFSCMSESAEVEERQRPTADKTDQVQLQKTLIQWNPKGPFMSVDENGMGCGWSGAIETWLEVVDLDKQRPYIWFSDSIMSCRTLEEFESGWHLECWQYHIAKFIGRYTHYVDFYIHKEFDPVGHKGWIFWTMEGTDLDWWCTLTIRVDDERPTYGWR